MKVFITGDTHGGAADGLIKLNNKNIRNITSDEKIIIIIAGDAGFIWDQTESHEEQNTRRWLEDKNVLFLFVDGNHENFDRINKLPQVSMFGGIVGEYSKNNIYHLKRGEIYIIEGKKYFIFGGGLSIDKWNRKEGLSWWKEEEPNELEYSHGFSNLDKYNNEVDYIITHDCPSSMYEVLAYTNKHVYELPMQLEKIKETVKYKDWYCGHHHIDYSEKNFHFLYRNIIPVSHQLTEDAHQQV